MLTTATVRGAKATGERYDVADGKVPGLQLRVGASGRKSWALMYRIGGRQRRLVLGTYPAVSLKDSRAEARKQIAAVARGVDPAHEREKRADEPTVAEAVGEYLARLDRAPRTVATYKQRLTAHVLPALGKRRLSEVTPEQVRKLHRALPDAARDAAVGKATKALKTAQVELKDAQARVTAGRRKAGARLAKAERKVEKAEAAVERARSRSGKVGANRVVETLRAFFSWAAAEWPGYVHENPARFNKAAGFKRNEEDLRTVTITDEERQALLAAIAEAESKPAKARGHVSKTYANAFRMAIFTGMRPVDIRTLRHENIRRAIVAGEKKWIAEWPASGHGRTKKANQRRTLNSAAIEIIEDQAQLTGGRGWVFPNTAGKQVTSGQLSRTFQRVRDAAGLAEDVTLYVAGRHTYVSEAVMAGVPLAVVGADVDNASAVHRYAHLERAAAGVSEEVLRRLRGEG